MKVRILSLLSLAVVSCAVAPCARAEWMERTEAIMGTRVYVELWAEDPARGNEALEAVMHYDWPGNVRELENALERAVVLTKGDTIGRAAMPDRITERRAEPVVAERQHANPTLEVIEQAYIRWVLDNEGGNKTRAAEVLGIDPSTLYRKLSRYDGTEKPGPGA